ncbi:SET domain-containing protein 8 [Ceratocystis fimbriata CBS 114723]|uniref:SET domain-containing protein 8 n=1 Tax=Ceratocystis fimbriata CBS 114723 TaxID=1035309 RepID=A0A2C5WWA6_9PEZI|nr:SET domain-containing protein 8 [Ceratocystis fimbriata CBS 114723]
MPILLPDPAPKLNPEVLPTWSRLNNLNLNNVNVTKISPEIGYGILAVQDIVGPQHEVTGSFNDLPVLRVPEDVVLSHLAIEEYAKVEPKFRQLLEAYGQASQREKFVLYLMFHRINSRHDISILPSPWTEYVKFLPEDIPTPTLWPASHIPLLHGTELAEPVQAKLNVLEHEYDRLVQISQDLLFLQDISFSPAGIALRDWQLADAWFRSRALEIPGLGTCMVPVLDMANHNATNHNAYWDRESATGDVVLMLRPGAAVAKGEEICINYGADRSAAEYLFAYGMFDMDSAVRPITLPFHFATTDPLAGAKHAVFKTRTPQLRITLPNDLAEYERGQRYWECPYAYLSALNAEDGLTFQAAQDLEGRQELHMFLDDEDITDKAMDIESLLKDLAIWPVINFRAIQMMKAELSVDDILRNFDITKHEELWDDKPYTYALAAQFAYTEAQLIQTATQYFESAAAAQFEDSFLQVYLQAVNNGADISPRQLEALIGEKIGKRHETRPQEGANGDVLGVSKGNGKEEMEENGGGEEDFS